MKPFAVKSVEGTIQTKSFKFPKELDECPKRL